jgi:hypothetical protein
MVLGTTGKHNSVFVSHFAQSTQYTKNFPTFKKKKEFFTIFSIPQTSENEGRFTPLGCEDTKIC